MFWTSFFRAEVDFCQIFGTLIDVCLKKAILMQRKWGFSGEIRYFIFVLVPLQSLQENTLTLHWCQLYFTQSVEQPCGLKSSLCILWWRRLVPEFMTKLQTTFSTVIWKKWAKHGGSQTRRKTYLVIVQRWRKTTRTQSRIHASRTSRIHPSWSCHLKKCSELDCLINNILDGWKLQNYNSATKRRHHEIRL